MQQRGLKTLPWATRAGVSEGAVRNFLKGKSDSLSQRTLERLAFSEGVSVAELTGESVERARIAVKSYVGAGCEVFPADDYGEGQGMDEVEAPEGVDPDDLIALRVRGDSMRPIRDGYVLFYRRIQDGVPDDCINQLCVVQVENGPMMVKELRRGYAGGRYNLLSWNAEPIDDVALSWAARVLWIKTD